ncbi:MAG: hypothetical protein LKCHEGNO_02519 [Burkholderiaceae bacterium]|nr:hypothetical protein [Burkholderiaceae bacterium]
MLMLILRPRGLIGEERVVSREARVRSGKRPRDAGKSAAPSVATGSRPTGRP